MKKADAAWERIGRAPGNSFDYTPPRGDGIVEYSFRVHAHLGSPPRSRPARQRCVARRPRPRRAGACRGPCRIPGQRGRCRRRAALNGNTSGAPAGFPGAGRQIPKARMPALPAHAHGRHRPPGGATAAFARRRGRAKPVPVPVQAPAPRPAWFGRGARRRHCPVQAALPSPLPSPKANAYTANWTLPHDEATMAGGTARTKARPRGGRARRPERVPAARLEGVRGTRLGGGRARRPERVTRRGYAAAPQPYPAARTPRCCAVDRVAGKGPPCRAAPGRRPPRGRAGRGGHCAAGIP